MKRLKRFNLITFIALICSVFTLNSKVYAASATVEFSSNSTVSVGSQITVTMYISNVNDTNGGIVSAGGNLSFDSNYLQYVSGTGVTSPYAFQINPSANYKLAGLDTSLSNGITTKTKVFTFVFKALKEGNTTITLNNASLTDTAQKVPTSVSSKSITISAPAPKSSDANLKALSVSGYTISPSFAAGTTSYSVTVPAGTTSVTLNATANDSAAKVSGAGKVNLSSDKTTATVKVTAEDGTVKNYTVTINREAQAPTPEDPKPETKSNDATLKSLDVSGYSLSPTFNSATTTYSIKVGSAVTGLKVNAVANHDKATVEVSGNNSWVVGNNTITIKVTAEDGTVNTYIVNANRASSTATTTKKSTDNYLKSLVVNSTHEISGTFDKNITNYTITVPNDVTNLDFTATKNHNKASIEIIGDEKLSTDKVNVIQIKVTAEDGSIRIYTLNVTRSAFKSDAYLKELNVKNGEMSPKFDSDKLEYDVKVSGKVDKLEIEAIPFEISTKVDILGNSNLKEGENSVLIKLTDKNNFTQVYTLNVTKESSKSTILGFTPFQFGLILFIIIAFLALILILFALLRKKDEKEEPKKERKVSVVHNTTTTREPSQTPIIEFKPEFNFSSKNTSDDDVVHGNMSQNREYLSLDDKKNKNNDVYDANYVEKAPYDPFDEIVTKDELYDAINEAKSTNDMSKLEMLLEQERLNRKKQEILDKEQEKKNDDWRQF